MMSFFAVRGTAAPLALSMGPVTAEAFIYEDGGDAAYFTSVFDSPKGSIDSDPEIVRVGARDGAGANVGGTPFDAAFVDGQRLHQSFALGFSGQTDQFPTFRDTSVSTADQAGDS
jgi:hypothetical protein